MGAGVRHIQMPCLAFLPYLPSTASIIYLVIKYPGGSLGQGHSSQIYILLYCLWAIAQRGGMRTEPNMMILNY